MTDLTDLLERTAARTPVGPPPLEALQTGAKRRRRRTAALTGATATVLALVGGATAVVANQPTRPHTYTVPVPPLELRLVGFGHAAIAVPADWPRNKSACGTPLQDTVQIDDPSMFLDCARGRPNGVDSVQLSGTPTLDFHADETFVIGGVRAERQRTSCMDGWQQTRVCFGAVGIPSLKVWFRAESSTGAADVDQLLSRIQIVQNRSGVPSPWSVVGPPTGPLVSGYLPLLANAGLKAEYKRVKSPSYPTGTILGVSPATGTMLPLGSTVTVTVAR